MPARRAYSVTLTVGVAQRQNLDGIQQIGTPIELYDHPANRFVAGFLGTANVIDGEFRADGRFVADGFVLDNAGGPAGSAALSIRPQDIGLEPPGAGLRAIVTALEFLGGVTRYRIRIGGHALTVDVPHRRDVAPLPVGAEVGIHIDPRQASILR